MLFDIVNAVKNADIATLISILISSCVLLLVCMPVHEMAHGFAAYKLGDMTAKYQGRLSLNPLHHLDPLGSALIILFGFGYAKPVPVNMMNFKNRKRDMALVALAGPVSNLLMALVFSMIQVLNFYFLAKFALLAAIIDIVCFYGATINISLAIFNFIPVPPLDGSRIIGYFLSDRLYYKIMQYERYIFIGVMILLATGFLSGPLGIMTSTVYGAFLNLFSLPFRLMGF